jgi:hypothetical protein
MWQLALVWVALTVVSYLLQPKTPKADDPVPGELTATTVDASSPVPILFGTRLLKQPNLIWYGDIGTTPIVQEGGGKK